MKTVEKRDGSIVRLSDEEAAKVVESKKGQYVPKSRWKAIRDQK